MVGCDDRPAVAVTRGANLCAIAARCRSDVGGRSAGRGREPLLLRRAAAAEPRLGGTTALANGQRTRPLALRPNKRLVMTGRLSTRDRIGRRPVIWWGVTAPRDGWLHPTPLRGLKIGAF